MNPTVQDRLRRWSQNQRVSLSYDGYKLLNDTADRLDLLEAEVVNLRAEVARLTAQQVSR